MHCVADFCVVPVGVSTSVTVYIAEAQRVLEKTGLKVRCDRALDCSYVVR